jgi:hypothetical protein
MTTTRTKTLSDIAAEVTRIERDIEKLKNPDAETQLDELVQEHLRKSGGTYAEALKAVRKAHPELAAAFVASFGCRKTAIRT